ncbi:MAG: hypothetical protein Q9220_007056 [cf. Caloplaca sp. 1 TL-2023]
MATTKTSPKSDDALIMPSGVKPEFFVSTYTASQFYQPLPPKWLKMKTHLPKNLDKPARESLTALESLADVRTKLQDFHDIETLDLLIDHKINLNAQFTPRNAFDYSEEQQIDRLSRLAEVRRKLSASGYGTANLDVVLRTGLDTLTMTTGISRSHSFLTAHLPIISFRTSVVSVLTYSPKTQVSLFFDDRTRQLAVLQSGGPYVYDDKPVKISLRDIWKATWAENSAKVCLHLFGGTTDEEGGADVYESMFMEMTSSGDARGFLQKMSGVANFKVVRIERYGYSSNLINDKLGFAN